MNIIKKATLFFTFLFLVSFQAQAQEELRSTQLKEILCADIVFNEFGINDPGEFDEYLDFCIFEADFMVTETYIDQGTELVTALDVDVSYHEVDLATTEGTARLIKSYIPDQGGQLQGVWSLGSKNYRTNSLRSTESLLMTMIENTDVWNGNSVIDDFDTETFDLDDAIADIASDLENPEDQNSGGCHYLTDSNTESVLDTLEFGSFDTPAPEFSEALHTLRLQNKIAFAVLRQHDFGGSSESCSYEYYRVYTTDGKVLRLDYDFTT